MEGERERGRGEGRRERKGRNERGGRKERGGGREGRERKGRGRRRKIKGRKVRKVLILLILHNCKCEGGRDPGTSSEGGWLETRDCYIVFPCCK